MYQLALIGCYSIIPSQKQNIVRLSRKSEYNKKKGKQK